MQVRDAAAAAAVHDAAAAAGRLRHVSTGLYSHTSGCCPVWQSHAGVSPPPPRCGDVVPCWAASATLHGIVSPPQISPDRGCIPVKDGSGHPTRDCIPTPVFPDVGMKSCGGWLRPSCTGLNPHPRVGRLTASEAAKIEACKLGGKPHVGQDESCPKK